MELLMLGGILLSVVSMFIASRRTSTDDCLQQAYIIKSLVLSFFAVGAFSVGRGLLDVMFANTLATGYLTMGGWIFAGPLILLFLFGFNRSPILQTASDCAPTAANVKANHWAKLQGTSLREKAEFRLLVRVIQRGLS